MSEATSENEATQTPAGRTHTPPTEGRSDDEARRRQVCRFFLGLIHHVNSKQPTEEWAKSWERYEAEPNDPAMVNLWRPKVDTQAAFIDNEPPVIQFNPAMTHAGDPAEDAVARTESAVWEYLNRELGIMAIVQQMRHSADVCQVGVVCNMPDLVRNMPTIEYLDPTDVAVDEGAGCDLKNAGWVAYSQYAAPDELVKWYPKLDLSDLTRAAKEHGYEVKRGGETTDLEMNERNRFSEDSGHSLKKCKFWRVFARGQYADYDKEPTPDREDEARKPGYAKRHGLVDAKRFLVLVEGLDAPAVDMDEWPRELLLDSGEWPITILSYNAARDTIWGFPDYRHEKNLLVEIDRVAQNLSTRKGMEGLKLGGQVGAKHTKETITAFLQGEGIQYLRDMLDSQGNPTVKPIDLDPIVSADIEYLQTLLQLYDQVAQQPRAARGDEDPDKTATATNVESELANARASHRLRLYEAVIVEVVRKTMQMAHVMLPQMTEVEADVIDVPDPDNPFGPPAIQVVDASTPPLPVVGADGIPQPPQVRREVMNMSWVEAQAALQKPGVELVALGVDAIAGDELAANWVQVQDGAKGAMTLVLRAIRVGIERGTTQRHVRMEKVKAFNEVLTNIITPLCQQLGTVDPMIEAAKKILSLLSLGEFESIVQALELANVQAQQMQAQQAAMGAVDENGQPIQPPAGQPPQPAQQPFGGQPGAPV